MEISPETVQAVQSEIQIWVFYIIPILSLVTAAVYYGPKLKDRLKSKTEA